MKHLHLVIEGFPKERADELAKEPEAEVFPLTEANAREALEKIFAADAVAVWTPVGVAVALRATDFIQSALANSRRTECDGYPLRPN